MSAQTGSRMTVNMRGRTTPPMFPAILTPAPSIPLTRPRAIRGEVRPVTQPRAVTRSVTILTGAVCSRGDWRWLEERERFRRDRERTSRYRQRSEDRDQRRRDRKRTEGEREEKRRERSRPRDRERLVERERESSPENPPSVSSLGIAHREPLQS